MRRAILGGFRQVGVLVSVQLISGERLAITQRWSIHESLVLVYKALGKRLGTTVLGDSKRDDNHFVANGVGRL